MRRLEHKHRPPSPPLICARTYHETCSFCSISLLPPRGPRRSVARRQIPVHAVRCEGARRASHPVSLPANGHHHRRHRLQAVGDRATMLPDDHDAHRADTAGRVLRFPQEVSSKFVLSLKCGCFPGLILHIQILIQAVTSIK